MSLTPIDTEDGSAYVKLSDVVLISQPMQKGKGAVVRRVGFAGGLYVFALNTPDNLRTLGLEDEAKRIEFLRDEAKARRQPRKPKGAPRV